MISLNPHQPKTLQIRPQTLQKLIHTFKLSMQRPFIQYKIQFLPPQNHIQIFLNLVKQPILMIRHMTIFIQEYFHRNTDSVLILPKKIELYPVVGKELLRNNF